VSIEPAMPASVIFDPGVHIIPWNLSELFGVVYLKTAEEDIMGLGRGLLLWLIGIPLPIIILIALFMHH
jgi:hypothetical protein